MNKDKDTTAVVFRVWKSGTGAGDVIALFPGVNWDAGHYALCTSYEHVGQHGGANYASVIRRTRPATPAEYADLRRELEGIGYALDVRKRWTR